MTTFTWVPEYGSQKSIKPSVMVNKFGDGYEQRFATGMNSVAQNWPLAFNNRDATESSAIEAFLIARGGVEAFTWTPVDTGTALTFVCRMWNKIMVPGNFFTITATFEQVFEP